MSQLSILCHSHTCRFNYLQLSLAAPEANNEFSCETCWELYGDKPRLVARIKYPFEPLEQVEYDAVIVPAKGNSFGESTEHFHIGLVHQLAWVLDFDKRGLEYRVRLDSARFGQCLRLDLLNELATGDTTRQQVKECWDDTVRKCLQEEEANRWSSSSYHEDHNNCFDFVLSFVNSLIIALSPAKDVSLQLASKDAFCDRFVKAKLSQAAAYMNLRESIAASEMVFVDKSRVIQMIPSLLEDEPIK